MQYSENIYDFKKEGKQELNSEKLSFDNCRRTNKSVSKVVFTGTLMAILEEL